MNSTVILSVVLVGSLIFNGVLFWYVRKLVNKLNFIYSNIGDVSEIITNYRAHLKSVYEMEMFYGDETLQHLLNHTRSMSNLLEEYEDNEFFLEEFEEDDEEEDVPQQEELTDGQTTINEENVFYAGTRRRDS